MQPLTLLEAFNRMHRRTITQEMFLRFLTREIKPIWKEIVARKFPEPNQRITVVTPAEWYDIWQAGELPGYGGSVVSPKYTFDFREEETKARSRKQFQELVDGFAESHRRHVAGEVPLASPDRGMYVRGAQYAFFPGIATVLESLADESVKKMDAARDWVANSDKKDRTEMTMIVEVPTPTLKIDLWMAEIQFYYNAAGTLHRPGECPKYPED